MSERLRWQPMAASTVTSSHAPGTRLVRLADPVRALADGDEAVFAIGAFDGLHIGHRSLLTNAADDARRRGLPLVVVTFDPDPAELLSPTDAMGSRLLGVGDRCRGMLGLGADAVLVCDFTPALAGLSPDQFVSSVLCAQLWPASVHVGTNFRFGSRGTGDVDVLRGLGARAGFDVHSDDLVMLHGAPVSASRVRACLRAGELAAANELLGRCHYVRGTVQRGRGEGTSFGFPTANVVCDVRDCMPAEGVYACYVTCGSRAWPSAANVGAPPTFSDPRPAFLEANLLGFEGDLYGADVCVSFVEWLRPSRVFDSFDELKSTVLGNIAWVGGHLGTRELEVGA